jgi:hypothetical protein
VALGWTAVVRVGADSSATPAPQPSYPLVARHVEGESSEATLNLEVGGETIVATKSDQPDRRPMSVVAEFKFQEQLLKWSNDPTTPARSLRRYSTAQATLKTGTEGVDLTLPKDRRDAIVELGPAGIAIAAVTGPLAREEFELIGNVPADPLAIDRLLPQREVKQGESWDHTAEAIGPLLGMDHVASCEVRSVVTGEENRQVQIRLAGVVQGAVDGAPTEMNLRAAYLYHLDRGRITKFNLAIERKSEPGEVSKGVDLVAKASLSIKPTGASPFDEAVSRRATDMASDELRMLLVDSPRRGYRFRHDQAWHVTADERELLSLRLLREGEMLAHCNITTHPPRPAGKPQTLQEFEKDVCDSLGESLEKVEAATEWTTAAGCRALGVIARGESDGVPIEWRYYHLSAEDCPQITLALSVEASQVDRLADAEKPLVESLELSPLASEATEQRETAAARAVEGGSKHR